VSSQKRDAEAFKWIAKKKPRGALQAKKKRKVAKKVFDRPLSKKRP